MSLPPFPAQDLAKLILGYLMEEQLIIAYDEFLQSSPYLDAFTNEYDRLSLMPLRTILAEFRAMRMFVETCKPITLRKKLLQCSNLLEMLRLLAQNVDLKKLCENEPVIEKHRIRTSFPVVNKSNLSKESALTPLVPDSIHTSDVEATPSEDLPGNSEQHSLTNSKMQQLDQKSQEVNTSTMFNSNKLPVTMSLYDYSQHLRNSVCTTTNVYSQRVSVSGYQDFATGVQDKINPVISECSTPHNNLNLINHVKLSSNQPNEDVSKKLILSAGNNNTNLQLPKATLNKGTESTQSSKSKVDNQKITILSNVKVDNNTLGKAKPNSVLQKTQTIYINGKPIYTSEPELSNKFTFTKDEIMAMPTIILVPTSSGAVEVPTNSPEVLPSLPSHKPLTIELPTNPLTIDITGESDVDTPQKLLLQTIEKKITSLPTSQSVNDKPSTPKNTKLIRKSCSTPRRSSHIRVLDFNTPRRILEGTAENAVAEIETVISKSPNINLEIGKPFERCNEEKPKVTKAITSNTPKENVPVRNNHNWDEDLRKHASMSEEIVSTPKSSIKKKKKPPEHSKKKHKDKSTDEKHSKSKSKSKKSKSRKSSEHDKSKENKIQDEPVNIAVKPTINIISEPNKKDDTSDEAILVENIEKRSKICDEPINTPENDPICLQNAIGAKLNISDFLETPYKQALYDIQMETPRFLGPDLGNEPISDIKIMNIPTPRFLNDPQVSQATPSSYSSRPTDYSSGGSYYKPDDHDYPIVLDLELPSTSSPVEEKSAKAVTPSNSVNLEDKPRTTNNKKRVSRPIRQCTKNVSYYNSPLLNNKGKTVPDKVINKSSSDDSSFEITENPEIIVVSEKKTKPMSKERRKSTTRSTPKIKPKIKSKLNKSPFKVNLNKHKKSSSSHHKGTYIGNKTKHISPVIVPGPTKSRRKSSTPRKLHSTKTINESSEKESQMIKMTYKTVRDKVIRWADDDSDNNTSITESEDITKIKEFIEKTDNIITTTSHESVKVHIVGDSSSKNLHLDLIDRGFDVEVAKNIEKDLLDISPCKNIDNQNIDSKTDSNSTKETETKPTEADKSCESNDEDLELTVHMFDEKCRNYVNIHHEEGSKCSVKVTLFKDDFTMDIRTEDENGDDDVIRLRATTLTDLFDYEPKHIEEVVTICNEHVLEKETEAAVQSISYIDRLYTPRKVMTAEEQAKCLEIFDSSLISLDTPMKPVSPVRKEVEDKVDVKRKTVKVTEVTLEIEAIDEKDTTVKEKCLAKKRKRSSGSTSEDSNGEAKKSKSEYLKNIKHFDIESVLSRLHGP